MVFEVKLEFKDTYINADGEIEEVEPREFVHTLAAPEDMEITGGQIFVENPKTSQLERFAFRIDRDDDGKPTLTVLENIA